MNLCILRMVCQYSAMILSSEPGLLTWIELLPYPRLIIDKGLTGPDFSDVSAATLWLYGLAASEFTLDGTRDRK